MAKQESMVKIHGTIDGATYYKTVHGYLVRKKTSLTKDRVNNDPAFARTRENASEFGLAGTAGKVLRDCTRAFGMGIAEGTLTARVFKIMHKALKLDTGSARGARKPAVGLATEAGKALLRGLNLNANVSVGAVLFKPLKVDLSTGGITIDELAPERDLAYPIGATHVRLSCAYAKIDFATGEKQISYSGAQTLALVDTPTQVALLPATAPKGSGVNLYLLKIEFLQETNESAYPFNNAAYNAATIVEVD
ncbi:MAG TPA: hypothetical protein VL947_09725 [Cytophagales bacterium]|nr:hypothetical protein [Cytophagales bacterium]